jgi:hypothetical protein
VWSDSRRGMTEANRLLAEHPWPAFLITMAVLLLILGLVQFVAPPHPHWSWFSWIVVGVDVYVTVVVALFPRIVRASARDTLIVRWGQAVAPALFGFVAAMSGSPVVLLLVGIAVSMVLLAFCAWSVAPKP